MTKICKLKPTRGEVYDNGILLIKPCGIKYSEGTEIECDRYAGRTCKYMLYHHIDQQQLEAYKIFGE